MIRLFCDRCKGDCDLCALDIQVNNIHNPVPHSVTDTGTPHLSDSYERKRFLLCQKCYREMGLPNVYEDGLVFMVEEKRIIERKSYQEET